jgi:hypothetical protein
MTHSPICRVVIGGVDLFGADRSLLQCAHNTGSQLAAIEGDPTAILLDESGQIEFRRLISGESFLAHHTATAPTYLITLSRKTGIDDLGILGSTKRAAH